MKSHLAACLMFLSIAHAAIASDKTQLLKEENIRKNCAGDIVAVQLPANKVTIRKGVKVKTGTAIFTLPSKVDEIGLGSNSTVFRYANSPKIVISSENTNTFQLASSNLNIYQILEHIFTKTSKDKDSTVKYQSDAWNKLLSIKEGLLSKSGKAYLYNKASLRIYYIADAGEPFKNIAWIVSTIQPDTATRIESNMISGNFKGILLSAELREK